MRTYPLVETDAGEALDHLSEDAGTRAAARAVLDGHKKRTACHPAVLGTCLYRLCRLY